MISEAYVTVVLPGQTHSTLVGRLQIEQTGRNIQANFVYGQRYCKNPQAIPLDPLRLPLDANRVYEAPGLWGTLGIFRDASPDYWGRMIIERETNTHELPEIDYLLRTSQTRIGALGFQLERDIHVENEQPVDFISIPDLVEASRQLENNTAIDKALMLLLRQGTSIGGARPKATVVENNTYWLAKFPSRHDRMNIPAIEYATLKLASSIGINIPDCRLLTLADDQQIFLTQRFDRQRSGENWQRLHYMSGLTVLGLNEFDNAKGGYPELADSLRQLSAAFKIDAEELFRRMVFNILISNDDDHLRNHALIYSDQGWRLSPAYDLLPHPQIGSERIQSIIVGKKGRQGSLGNALSDAGRFGLTTKKAADIVDEIKQKISQWPQHFDKRGVSAQDIDLLQTAFMAKSTLK